MVQAAPVQCPPHIVALAHRRWTIPLIAQIHSAARSGNPTLARMPGLCGALGVTRESLRVTIAFAIDQGWIERNPGHGHPLRPDFALTADGRALAPACAGVWRVAVLSDSAGILARKWSAPVVRVLGSTPETAARFGQIRSSLSPLGLTDRALTQTLRPLQEASLVARTVEPSTPPRVVYALTPDATPLADAIGRL